MTDPHNGATLKDSIQQLEGGVKLKGAATQPENFANLKPVVDETAGSCVVTQRDDPSLKSLASQLQGDALDNFRLSGKKVKMPMFSSEDPTGWIARA